MEDETPRTPRPRKPRTKTAVVGVAGEVKEVKPRARRAAPRKKASAASTEEAPVARKAPTQIAETRRVGKRSRTLQYVSLAIFILSFVASAAIGFSDNGQINVGGTTITQAGENLVVQNEQGETVVVPTQQQQPVNSGLVPSGQQPEPVALPEPTASSTDVTTASSTDATASSTEAELAEAENAEEGAGGQVAGETTDAIDTDENVTESTQ